MVPYSRKNCTQHGGRGRRVGTVVWCMHPETGGILQAVAWSGGRQASLGGVNKVLETHVGSTQTPGKGVFWLM